MCSFKKMVCVAVLLCGCLLCNSMLVAHVDSVYGQEAFSGVAFTWSPGNPMVNENVTFVAYSSGDVVVNWYYWDWNDTQTSNVTGNTVGHVFGDYGVYNVTLVVNSELGDAVFAQVVTVGNAKDSFWLFLALCGVVGVPVLVGYLLLFNRRGKRW